jgi:hypothetical protein
VKAKLRKNIVVKYQISKRIRPSDKIVERPRCELREAYHPYRTLSNVKNTEAGTKKYTPARIYASDTIAYTSTTNNLSISVTEALRMNGVERRGTDLTFK